MDIFFKEATAIIGTHEFNYNKEVIKTIISYGTGY